LKIFGVLLLVVGLAWGVMAFGMQTTVLTEGGGSVYNIGLIDDRKNSLMGAGLLVIVGTILVVAGGLRSNTVGTDAVEEYERAQIEDHTALDRATRAVMVIDEDADDYEIEPEESDPTRLYDMWVAAGTGTALRRFLESLEDQGTSLPRGASARDQLVQSYPAAEGNPEFEALAAFQESL